MAIKSFSFILVAVSILSACRSTPPKKVPTGARPEIGLPPSAQHPAQTTTEEQAPAVTYEPSQPKKVAVILGPGGAKSFAHVGVLKAFQQQRIPIDKIVGLEWGALIAGMYAVKGQTHDVEWKLYKMEQQHLLEPKGFFNRRNDGNSINVMDSFLNETFGNENISRARVPFMCPTRSIYSGVVAWQSKGLFKDVMKRCMQFPPIFRPQGTFLAGASQASEAVEMLVKEGYNVIILVNVLGSALPVGQDGLRDNLNYVILWQEIRRAILETSRLNIDTVTVDTSNYPMMQFAAKKDLISLGEAAGFKAANGLISKYGF
jgi:NTE family protein